MFDSFSSSSKVSTRVPTAQKAGASQKEDEAQKSFSIVWRQTSATIGFEVKLDITANMIIKDAALIGINIMFNNTDKVGVGEIVEVNGKKITAKWKVKARNAGMFTSGSYTAQLTYNGTYMAATGAPLKIVSGVGGGDSFVSGR